jgi:hypothetical protein
VRDLIIMIRRSQVDEADADAVDEEDPLVKMQLLMDDADIPRQRLAITGLMARQMIPRQYYGISESDAVHPIYYMPFDHTPLSEYHTGSLNFGVARSAKLSLTLAPGEYTVDILARTVNVIDIEGGMGKIRWISKPEVIEKKSKSHFDLRKSKAVLCG